MIILARPVSYGGNAIRYAAEKEKAEIIKINHLPQNITPMAIWHRMKMHCQLHHPQHTRGRPMTDFMVTFVVSPTPEESAGWTSEDWRSFQDEVLHELDNADISKEKGCRKCKHTNFRNSMNVGALHRDSSSGILHLHIDCCRLDLDGSTNDTHQIHKLAMKAAENINRRHGWRRPEEIRQERIMQMSRDGLKVLQDMPVFDMNAYFAKLREKGYEVNVRTSKEGKVCGYTVGMGATVVKASEIGIARRLMVSKLENTWRFLHKNDKQKHILASPVKLTAKPRPTASLINNSYVTRPLATVQTAPERKPTFTMSRIEVGGKFFDCNIPDSVKDIFEPTNQILDDVLWSKVEDIANTAKLLFCGYIDAATTIAHSCGGGGGNTSAKGWGRDKDEDDETYARRCRSKATSMHKRYRGRSR